MKYLDQERQAGIPDRDAGRLYYLDWLRLIATLGVFLFHASNVFNTSNSEIKNAEGSLVIMAIQVFFYPWGMPLFFMVSGAGSWFAMRRRTARQFTRERTLRILVPFLTGTILLGPVQLYLSWRHKTETGVFEGTLMDFTVARLSYISPKLFGAIGYHMWFLGFLFAFSLLALPLFTWLKGPTGQRLAARLAGWCERRGRILIFILPLVVVRLVLQMFSPEMQNWADFFYYWAFFVLGFLMYADNRFTQAIRRDWPILLGVGLTTMLAGMVIGFSTQTFDVESPPRTASDYLIWIIMATCGWCWTTFVFYTGMRFMNRDHKSLHYGQAAMLPFFVVHQPVILAIAYFVVQWDASILVKFLILSLGSFLVSIGIYELIIKPVSFLRLIFGIKADQFKKVQG